MENKDEGEGIIESYTMILRIPGMALEKMIKWCLVSQFNLIVIITPLYTVQGYSSPSYSVFPMQ